MQLLVVHHNDIITWAFYPVFLCVHDDDEIALYCTLDNIVCVKCEKQREGTTPNASLSECVTKRKIPRNQHYSTTKITVQKKISYVVSF